MVGRVSIRIGESAPGLSTPPWRSLRTSKRAGRSPLRDFAPRPPVFVTLRDRLCFNIRAAQRGALFHHRIYPRNIMKLRACLATLLFLCIVVGDQVIKYLVKTGMSLGERIHVTDWFYILGRRRIVHLCAGKTDTSRRAVGVRRLFVADHCRRLR